MKKDKVVKIVMSAAVMASVAAAPVQAEGGEEFAGAGEVRSVDAGESGQAGGPETGSAGAESLEAEYAETEDGRTDSENASGQQGDGGQGQGAVSQEEPQEETQEELSGAAGMETQEELSGTAGMEIQEESSGAAGTVCQAYEAVYSAHTSVSGGPGVVKWQRRIEEPPQEYGPHCVSLLQEETQEAEPDMPPEPETPSYTEEDLYILAHAICGEGQCYPDEEQLYIGSVILNRRDHSAYPDTIKGVVFQRGQYACTWDGNYYREPTEANWRNARWLLENGSILPGNVVYQAGFRQGSGLYLQTRYHKYCYRS